MERMTDREIIQANYEDIGSIVKTFLKLKEMRGG